MEVAAEVALMLLFTAKADSKVRTDVVPTGIMGLPAKRAVSIRAAFFSSSF